MSALIDEHLRRSAAGVTATVPLLATGAAAGEFVLRGVAGFATGDIVAVAAGGRTVVGRLADVKPDDPVGIALPLLDRRVLGSAVGSPVEVTAVDAVATESMTLLVSDDGQKQTARRFETALRATLAGQPVTPGRQVEIVDAERSSACAARVATCSPPVSVVTPDTDIHVHLVGELEVAALSGYVEVGGLTAEIAVLQSMIEMPLLRPDLYREAGVHPPRGVILHGPAGVGKTHLARALASELGVHSFAIGGVDLIGMRYGETESALRRLFLDAATHAPALIIIDELDALVPHRGESGAQTDIRVVSQVLTCLDGLIGLDGVFIIGTTNRLEAIDPAIRRPGRFDRELWVRPPDRAARAEILAVHARPMPLTPAAAASLPDIARRTPGYVGADLMALCREAGLAAVARLDNESNATAVTVDTADFESALATLQPTNGRRTGAVMSPRGWERVWGLNEVKQRLERFAAAALDTGSPLGGQGILLHGGGGHGKTVLAEGLPGELGANLVMLRSTDVFTKWLGESEQAVRSAFELARNLRPTVVVLDQLESLCGRDHQGEPAARRVRNELLAELDDPRNAGVLVVGTTRDPADVDPALLREGRIGVHLEVPAPTRDDRSAVLAGHLATFDLPAPTATAVATCLDRMDGWSGARIELLAQLAALHPEEDLMRLIDDMEKG
jgi:transitional endoplasmic reticulum ATPase